MATRERRRPSGGQREVDGDHGGASGRADEVEAPVDRVHPVGEAAETAGGGADPGELGAAEPVVAHDEAEPRPLLRARDRARDACAC